MSSAGPFPLLDFSVQDLLDYKCSNLSIRHALLSQVVIVMIGKKGRAMIIVVTISSS